MKFSAELVIRAYANGYFPMQDPKTREIHWYRPDPRAILPLEEFHISHSLQRTLRKQIYTVTFDTAFAAVMKACAARAETWIGEDIFRVYQELSEHGLGHSVEVWQGTELAGGLYGLALGGAFFAESKFHVKTDASKVALAALVERLKHRRFSLLEVQFLTPHLQRLGAREIPGDEYDDRLAKALESDASWDDVE